jgi:hypothetical protein
VFVLTKEPPGDRWSWWLRLATLQKDSFLLITDFSSQLSAFRAQCAIFRKLKMRMGQDTFSRSNFTRGRRRIKQLTGKL